jgi:Fe-S oxidoreductase
VLPDIINEDLRRLFPDAEGDPVVSIFQANSRQLVHDVHDWTGVNRDSLGSLTHELSKRVETLELKIEPDKNTERITNLAIFISTLAMNYQYSGKFVKND